MILKTEYIGASVDILFCNSLVFIFLLMSVTYMVPLHNSDLHQVLVI
jgi:hypothetical protein